jgi:mono/diheme cytochrome c family protein
MGAKHLMATGLALAVIGGVTSEVAGRSPDQEAEKQTSAVATTAPGKETYRSYCASCHGESGKGNGPVAPHLRRPPTDLTRYALENKGVFPADRLERLIDGREVTRTHGQSDMPVWGDAFKKSVVGGDDEAVKQRIRQLVRYIESIQERLTNDGTPR